MHFMNVYEVDEAAHRWREHPILGPATRTLVNLVNAVNAHSDGWASWQAPVRAADKLMTLIEAGHEGSFNQALVKLHAAYVPLKRFRTSHKLDFEIVEPKRQPLPRSAWGMSRSRGVGGLFGPFADRRHASLAIAVAQAADGSEWELVRGRDDQYWVRRVEEERLMPLEPSSWGLSRRRHRGRRRASWVGRAR